MAKQSKITTASRAGRKREADRSSRSGAKRGTAVRREDKEANSPTNLMAVYEQVARWAEDGRWVDAPETVPEDLSALETIATSEEIPLPLLLDLAVEFKAARTRFRSEPPQIIHGWRDYGAREATETVVIQAPLLEPAMTFEEIEKRLKEKSATDGSGSVEIPFRAFRGWLRVERVPVPLQNNGKPHWPGGHVYLAPAFAILDQDEAFRAALQNAESCVRSLAGSSWPTDSDFRVSFARTDGGVLPPILFGDHVGAALALLLAKVAGIEPFKELHFRGCSVLGAVDGEGRLSNGSFDSQIFRESLEAAARAGKINFLLSSPQIQWPSHWRDEGASPLRVRDCESLHAAAAALRPASLVIEAELRAAEQIEFLTGKQPIASHYQDVPLLCEVPRAKLRERQVAVSRPEIEESESAALEADESENTVLVYDHEERLHEEAWTLDRTPVGWRELFSDFPKVCPQALSEVPHFILIGVPGSGKSTFAQFVTWHTNSARSAGFSPGAVGSPGFSPPSDSPPSRGRDGTPNAKPAEAGTTNESSRGRDGTPNRLAVRVSLRDWEEFSLRPGAARHLEDFLAAEHAASRQHGGPTREDWRDWLNAGRLLLLLDGLDEVKADGRFARELLSDLTHWRGRSPIVLTCRTLNIDAYRAALSEWPIFAPARLNPEQIHDFIERYPRVKGELRTDELERQLKDHPEMQPLAEIPMLLNVICFVVDDGLRLPATRAELYSVAVDRLLERDHDPPLAVFSHTDPDHLRTARRILAAVAARLFRANEGLKPLDPEAFGDALDKAMPTHPPAEWGRCKEDLKNWFLKRSGLVRASQAGYTFLHNQFLEFLAGEGLAADPQFGAHVAAGIRNVDAWREVIKYAAGRKLAQNRPEDVRGLLTALAGASQPASDLDWQKTVLAGEVALDLGREPLGLEQGDGATCLGLVRERLAALIEKESLPENRQGRKGLTVHERAHAGEILGRLGDPRPGVGLFVVPALAGEDRLKAELRTAADTLKRGQQTALPDIVFVPGPTCSRCGLEFGVKAVSPTQAECPQCQAPCEVPQPLPAATFTLAENNQEVTIEHPYRISRYPVTVAQFQAFVDDKGYERDEFWTPKGLAWRDGKADSADVPDWFRDEYRKESFPILTPKDYDPVFQTPNHPRVGVSWYEAWAFCKWLTERLREQGTLKEKDVIRLPNEGEWEQAARWNNKEKQADDRRYPWGGEEAEDELTARCNWYKSGIGHNSAVGLFPNGVAECGAADLSGNVWEWCKNWYDKDEDVRVLRGGSWFYDVPLYLSCSYRYSLSPDLRDQLYGFRCVWVGVGSAPRWRHRTMGAMPDGKHSCPARAKRSPNRPPHAPPKRGKDAARAVAGRRAWLKVTARFHTG